MLDVPDDLRPVLDKHLSVLRDADEAGLDEVGRIALLRRARKEVSDLLATEGYFSPTVTGEAAADGRYHLVVAPGPRTRVSQVDLRFHTSNSNVRFLGFKVGLQHAKRFQYGVGYSFLFSPVEQQVEVDGVQTTAHLVGRQHNLIGPARSSRQRTVAAGHALRRPDPAQQPVGSLEVGLAPVDVLIRRYRRIARQVRGFRRRRGGAGADHTRRGQQQGREYRAREHQKLIM